jgi:general secretion pathway protein G
MTPTFSHGDARPAAAQTGLSTLDTALSQFRSDTGRYPTAGEDLTALLTAPASITDWHGPYIQHPPIDPWEHPYVYRTFLRHGVWKYELFSAGPDGQPGTGDDISTRIDP